jgi:hypothetical protein
MFRRTNAAQTKGFDPLLFSTSPSRWKRIAFALFVSGVFFSLPTRGHTAGLDCPEIGPGTVPNLFTNLQVKLVTSGNIVDLANEINDLINKLQIEKPNISYAELTDVAIAAYCPVVANTTIGSWIWVGLMVSHFGRWKRDHPGLPVQDVGVVIPIEARVHNTGAMR